MKILIATFLFLSTVVLADVTMKKSESDRPDVTLPIEPPLRPIRPVVRPVFVQPAVVYQDNYYNTNYASNCEQYITLLNQKDDEIAALRAELSALQNKEQSKLQKKLQKEYNEGLKEFENRHSDSTPKSRAIISNEPID